MEKKFDALTMHITSKIEERRDAKGITQEELALKTGISRASMVNMENGRQGISLRRLFDMAVELGIEAKDLIPTNEWYKEHKNKKLRKIITFEVVD